MKKFVLFFLAALLLLVALGAAFALGLHASGVLQGTTVTIDGESIDGALTAALFGGVAAVGVVVAGLAVVAILASVAIAVPVAVFAVVLAVLATIVIGLAPLLLPALLLVGGCVLLARRAKRRAATRPVVFPDAPAAS